MVNVLFVCLGNICRSPTAEGVFRHLVRAEGLDGRIATDSAGTGNWHVGNAPDRRAQAAARRRGVDLSDLRARQAIADDFARFDYVIAMDRRNLRDLQAIAPKEHEGRLHLFLSFAPHLGIAEVPDPYYGGDDGFEAVLDMVGAASHGLLDHIRKNHLAKDPT